MENNSEKDSKQTPAPAKRTHRFHNASYGDVVSSNCMLANKVVDLNKAIMEKNDELLKTQRMYHDEVIKNMTLKSVLDEKKNKIIQLERKLEEVTESQYCHDLIKFNDSENDAGELLFSNVSIFKYHKFSFIYFAGANVFISENGSNDSQSAPTIKMSRERKTGTNSDAIDVLVDNSTSFRPIFSLVVSIFVYPIVIRINFYPAVKSCFVKILRTITSPESVEDGNCGMKNDSIRSDGSPTSSETDNEGEKCIFVCFMH